MNFKTIMRDAERFDRLQADEAADAVIDMDDEVAGGQACQFGDEVLRAALLALRTREPIAENVLLGDDRDIGGLEACFNS